MIESPLNDTDNINSFLVSGLNTVNVKRQEAARRLQDLPLVIQLPDQKNHISHQESKIILLFSAVLSIDTNTGLSLSPQQLVLVVVKMCNYFERCWYGCFGGMTNQNPLL